MLSKNTKLTLYRIFLIFSIYVLYSTGLFFWRIWNVIDLSRNESPFERIIPDAEYKMLIVGDSTAVGTGVFDNTKSVAGIFGSTYPDISITNLGVNGLKTDELLEILNSIEDDTNYDLIIIHIGANDIIRFTNINYLKRELQLILDKANSIGDEIVLITSGNVGLAPAFPRHIGWIMTYRTKLVHKEFIKIAAEKNVLWVDLFVGYNNNPFKSDPVKYYAKDFFHPGPLGYQYWYDKIAETLEENNILIPG